MCCLCLLDACKDTYRKVKPTPLQSCLFPAYPIHQYLANWRSTGDRGGGEGRGGEKYKQSQHGGVKGEESPPPTTVRAYFRLGLQLKITFSRGSGGWSGIHCFWHGAVGLCHKKSMLLQVPAPPWPSVSIKLNAKQMRAATPEWEERRVRLDECLGWGGAVGSGDLLCSFMGEEAKHKPKWNVECGKFCSDKYTKPLNFRILMSIINVNVRIFGLCKLKASDNCTSVRACMRSSYR